MSTELFTNKDRDGSQDVTITVYVKTKVTADTAVHQNVQILITYHQRAQCRTTQMTLVVKDPFVNQDQMVKLLELLFHHINLVLLVMDWPKTLH